MATYTKRGNSWLGQVRLRGVSEAFTRPTKSACMIACNALESEILSGKHGKVPDILVSKLLAKYANEVASKHKGAKWEINRLNLLQRDLLAEVNLRALDQPHIAQWRDRRLKTVSNASVNREWNLLSAVFTISILEWRMLEKHPMKGVKRPPKTAPRNRLPTQDEIDALKIVMGSKGDTIVSRVYLSFLFAIETGMRLGEIATLDDVKGRVAYLTKTKNGDDREVPLSAEARRLWDKAGPFNVTPQQIDIHFRKSTEKAAIDGLHFHDSRHLAVTNLAKKLNVLELARAIGHRNIKELMTYYNPATEDLAAKLN